MANLPLEKEVNSKGEESFDEKIEKDSSNTPNIFEQPQSPVEGISPEPDSPPENENFPNHLVESPDKKEDNTLIEEEGDIPVEDIPEYALNRNVFKRHKLLQEALLTPELIKLFDSVCEYIIQKEKNYFNLSDYIMTLGHSFSQIEILKRNFQKMVDLLTTKTIDLIKVAEKDKSQQPLAIILLEKKNFNLFLYHKFNDYITKIYDPQNPVRKPILYNLTQVAEFLKVSHKELSSLCIFKNLQKIDIESLKDMKKVSPNSGKVALAINLENEHFGEAIVPFSLAVALLDYLSSQINEYTENVSNEKIVGLINKKLWKNKIEFPSIKKYLLKPDPYNPNYAIFIRIFYAIMTQVYNRNYAYSNKKIKEIEYYLVISLIARQLILNSKLSKQNQEPENDKKNKDLQVIEHLLSNIKEINKKAVRVPMSLKTLVQRKPSDKNSDTSENTSTPKFSSKELLNTFKNLNNDNNTIKEVLIMRIEENSYYLHRVAIIPLFLNMLEVEKTKIQEAINFNLENNHKKFVKNETVFNDFIQNKVSKLFISIYECLVNCFMTSKPGTYFDSQSVYWLNRFFFSYQEIKKYNLFGSDLDVNENDKRKILKNTIEAITYPNQDFKNLPALLDVPFDKYHQSQLFFPLDWLTSLLKRLFFWTLSIDKKDNQKYQGKKLFSGISHSSNKENISDKYFPSEFSDGSSNNQSIYNYSKKEKPSSNYKELMNKMKKKFSLLQNPEKLKKLIDEEHDNWNLKIGDTRTDSKKAIDNIVNNCILRLDIKYILEEDFDTVYNVLARNNPLLKKIKNQEALRKYMFYRIILEKHDLIRRQSYSR